MSEPDPKRVRAGKLSRRKGKVFERLVCQMFRDAGFTAERSQQYKGNADSADIQVKEFPNWHFECKHSKVVQLEKWCDQARTDAGGIKAWAVIYKQDRCEPMFVANLCYYHFTNAERYSVDRSLQVIVLPLEMALKILAKGDSVVP